MLSGKRGPNRGRVPGQGLDPSGRGGDWLEHSGSERRH